MIEFTIYSAPRTKKNHSTISYKGGYPRLIPSEAYRKFESAAKPYCPATHIDYPVNLKCIFYVDRRNAVDLANMLNGIDDVLVKYGTIVDDNRNIVYSHDGSRILYDHDNPRVEVTITRIRTENFQEWNLKQKSQKTSRTRSLKP